VKKAPDKCPFCESPILVHGGNPLKSENGGFATYECKSVQDIIWSDAEFKRAAQSEVCRRREVILLTRRLDEANNRIKQLEAFVNRFLDPEDLGYAVNKYFRDDAREALGMKRVESLNKDNCT
jgi:hypothetical protein